MKDRWVDSKIVAVGSTDKGAGGKHYYRSIWLHKQS